MSKILEGKVALVAGAGRGIAVELGAAGAIVYCTGRSTASQRSEMNLARWNGQSLSSGQVAKVYGFTDVDGSQPDAWRYVVEIQDKGKVADATGYR